MRILVVSNLYPPDAVGGYEGMCAVAVEGLRERGHHVTVLTRRPRVPCAPQRDVLRSLRFRDHQDPFAVAKAPWFDLRDRAALSASVAAARPDVVYLWGMRGVGVPVVATLTREFPSVAYVPDFWFRKWITGERHFDARVHHLRQLARRDPPVPRAARAILGRTLGRPAERAVASRWRHWVCGAPRAVQFVSSFMAEDVARCGIALASAPIIPIGIDLDRFPFDVSGERGQDILFAGQVSEHKGVLTLVRAVAAIRSDRPDVHVRFVGPVLGATGTRIEALARDLGVSDAVSVVGPVPRDEMPALYRAHRIVVVPSEWDEPGASVLLEAMACGASVVASDVGGTAEILGQGRFGRLFPAGDADALALAVRESYLQPFDPVAAREHVAETFSAAVVLDAMEADLARAAEVPA